MSLRSAARRRTSWLCADASALAVAALACSVSGADDRRAISFVPPPPRFAPPCALPFGLARDERSRRVAMSASICSRARTLIVASGGAIGVVPSRSSVLSNLRSRETSSGFAGRALPARDVDAGPPRPRSGGIAWPPRLPLAAVDPNAATERTPR